MLLLMLALLCFVVAYIYNKNDKCFLKSFFKVLWLILSCLIIASVFFTSAHDVQDSYPGLPILSLFHFAGGVCMYGIPLFYIVSILILLKLEKR